MSLLGETVDNIISIITNIFNSISGLINFIYNMISISLDILGYFFEIIKIIVNIILNPYLIAFFIVGCGFYYAAFTAKTRKDLLNKTGIYYYNVVKIVVSVFAWLFNIIIKLVTGIIDMI